MLDESILQLSPLAGNAGGCLVVDGFITDGGRMLPVMVWGVDDDIKPGCALINEPLDDMLQSKSTIVLHLPRGNMVPSGSLFVTQTYTTQMRLDVTAVKTTSEGGNMMLRNEQVRPLNVFVNRSELGETMDLKGRINLILSASHISRDSINAIWRPEMSGIHVSDVNDSLLAVTTDRVFLPRRFVETPTDTYLAYFVNSIISAHDTIPYSFVTAATRWNDGTPLTGHDMILSDYAAKRLKAAVGDTIGTEYFVAHGLKSLDVGSRYFVVRSIVPLAEFQDESLLHANFPGLSHVARCTDWDSDLPIQMNRIMPADEKYWEDYRQTPKAVVAYDAVRDEWSNAYGVATAFTITKSDSMAIAALNNAERMGAMTTIYPRETALKAAVGGTDFTSLFLALGFFIIISAILLMIAPLAEMYAVRAQEIQTYVTMGFSKAKIRCRLLCETFTVSILASPVGLLAGYLYSATMLWMLGGTWSGATHTDGFIMHFSLPVMLWAWLIGITLSFIITCYSIKRHTFVRYPSTHTPATSGHQLHINVAWIVLTVATVTLIIINFTVAGSIILFAVCGLLWLLVGGLLIRGGYAYWSLALGVFTVFAVGLWSPDLTDRRLVSGMTGGYEMYCDLRVPLQYDLNNAAVRHRLALDKIPAGTRFMQISRHTQDEASCLNLNKVETPSVLGADLSQMASFGINPDNALTMTNGLYPVIVDEEALVWSMMKSVGDTMHYVSDAGQEVKVLIAGTYTSGILHGNAIMDRKFFNELWPDDAGSSIILADKDCSQLMATALHDYGIRATTTYDRLYEFFTVYTTYLSIFLTLGGMGLLLGIAGMVVIVRKRLTARRDEIRMYHIMGYTRQRIHSILMRENIVEPMVAIVVGFLGAFISVSANVGGAGWAAWSMALLFFIAFIVINIILLNKIISSQLKKQDNYEQQSIF